MAKVDKLRIPSGSDTYPLDAMAALSADRKTLTIAIANPTESDQQIDVAARGVAVKAKGRLSRICAAELSIDNVPAKPAAVDIAESPLTWAPGGLTVPKFSMRIYELPVQ